MSGDGCSGSKDTLMNLRPYMALQRGCSLPSLHCALSQTALLSPVLGYLRSQLSPRSSPTVLGRTGGGGGCPSVLCYGAQGWGTSPSALYCGAKGGGEPVPPPCAVGYGGGGTCPSTLCRCSQGWGTCLSALW